MLKIASGLKDSIVPDIMPFISIKTIEIHQLPVIEIDISPGVNRPYYIRSIGLTPSGVYVRKGSASQPLSEEGIRKMIRQVDGTSFEEERSLNQNLTFNTLQGEMDKRQIAFDTPQMKTLHLINKDNLYTNLAFLLSDQCTYVTKVAMFQGSDQAIFRDRKEFTGSLLKQLEDCYQYIENFNKVSATFSGLMRYDHKDYPEEALREALLNAICHRDYSKSYSNIINIFDDRIEFISVGGLLPDYTLESIFLGLSAPRNPNLCQVFYRMHLIESYGTGILKIKRNYQNATKKPIFESAPGVFKVTLPNTYQGDGSKSAIPLKSQNQTVTKQVLDTSTHSKDISNILEYVDHHGEITRKDVETMLNIKTTSAYNILKKLCNEHILKAIGKGRSIKYQRDK